MERLTRRDSDGDAICTVKDCRNDNCSWNCSHDIAVWNKLAEYEDAEEQGLLVRLPCKVGDAVYLIVGDIGEDGKIKDVKVDTDIIQRISIRENTKVFTGRYSATYEENFGKTVFLTKAEAEATLADMRKKVQE